MTFIRKKWNDPYIVLISVDLLFVVFAFLFDTSSNIANGMRQIFTSRGILITDYVDLGGPGAALINAALAGAMGITMMKVSRVTPNGAIIMAIWLNIGFALFGKNILNMLPLMAGVWLYSHARREPFSNYSLTALMSATLAPIVSEIALTDILGSSAGSFGGWISGAACGLGIGFIFPSVAAYVVRVHGGYNLYNMGFAGGLISTIFMASLNSLGITVPTSLYWASGHNLQMAVFLYALSALLLTIGFVSCSRHEIALNLEKLVRHSGRLVTDYYLLYSNSVYVNMALLCIFSTTLVLVAGGELNGPTIGGILTITGFGCFGKHLRNISPVLFGAILSSWLGRWDFTSPSSMLAILFSTCLAPISGQFGILWGILAGFLHVRLVHHVSYLCNGLNLYNNGFAAGFVVMFLLPLITVFRKEKEDEANI